MVVMKRVEAHAEPLTTEGGNSYLPDGVYANLRNLNNLRLMNTEEKTRCMNRLNRWLSIYFPEYGTVFKDVSGTASLLLLEQAALPEDIYQ